MSTSSFLNRFLICISILLLALTQSFASKTTWMGPGNDWSTDGNWDNGVPTSLDSAIITGGTANLNINVLISAPVLALHVTVEEHCNLSVLFSASLTLVVDALANAIVIEENGTFLNGGNVNIENAGNGFTVFGSWENTGKCVIDSVNNGLVLFGNAVAINSDLLEIKKPKTGISISEDAVMTNENDGTISVALSKNSGISNDGNFTNLGDIDIFDGWRIGISNCGVFVNNGELVLFYIIGFGSVGITNDSITNQFGETFIGNFENNDIIEMTGISDTGIRNMNSTTFVNNGILGVYSAGKNGMINLPRSTFTMSAGAGLYLPNTSDYPLDVQLKSVFEIAKGTEVIIGN